MRGLCVHAVRRSYDVGGARRFDVFGGLCPVPVALSLSLYLSGRVSHGWEIEEHVVVIVVAGAGDADVVRRWMESRLLARGVVEDARRRHGYVRVFVTKFGSLLRRHRVRFDDFRSFRRR